MPAKRKSKRVKARRPPTDAAPSYHTSWTIPTPNFTFWQPGYQFNLASHKVMVYFLVGLYHQRHYIGCTKDIYHRLRQHNGEIAGGAGYTAKYPPWTPIYIITGFSDRRNALRFETKIQHCKVRKGKMDNRQWGARAIQHIIASGDGPLAWPVLTVFCY